MKSKIKTKVFKVFLAVLFIFPNQIFALSVTDFLKPEGNLGLSSASYVLVEPKTGKIWLEKNSTLSWPPASLTKLVTAMVVLDTNPGLAKNISMKKEDEVGGVRIKSVPGTVYKTRDLFYASLISSANNATNALARSTGLSREKFVEKMNAKAKSLGAENTLFVEPSGISEKNVTNAKDFAKITSAAFAYLEIAKAANLSEYFIQSVNKKKYNQTLKNTNKLLNDSEFLQVLGKTGYINESKYNFTAEVKNSLGENYILVLFGARNSSLQFSESKQLVLMATISKAFGILNVLN